jgi:peptidoglycan hydrolase-like protein with peptidoglycan-binding domain
MKRIVRLTESDLARIVRRVISEDDRNTATYTGSKEGDIKMFQQAWQSGDVTSIQNQLGIRADGKKGPQTVTCLKEYQTQMGLNPDGVVGPDTAAKIFETSRRSGSYVKLLKQKNPKMYEYCTSNTPSQSPSKY